MSPDPDRAIFVGRAASLPRWEQNVIFDTAAAHSVDAIFLAAIRLAEMGGPGREFGVLSVPAPTYGDQCDVAARSIRNSMDRYETDTGKWPIDGRTGRLTPEWIRFFAARWAPIGVANDPTGLNQNWLRNASAAYSATQYADTAFA
jgi:hypothetical protein